MSRKSARRRGFGVYLGSLRDSRDETQPVFAETLNVSRSVIGNVETGTPPSAPFLAHLETFFPEKKDEIKAEAQRHSKRSRNRSISRRDHRATQQRITTQIAANELLQAKEVLLQEIKPGHNRKHLVWCVETLSRVERRLGDIDASRWRMMFAIDLARLEPGSDDAVIAWCDEFVLDCYQDSRADNGLDALGMALDNFPAASQLWYRKGVIHADKG